MPPTVAKLLQGAKILRTSPKWAALVPLAKPVAEPEATPAPWQLPPEVQARIDEFNRQIGPAMVQALRKATIDKK